MLALTVRLQRVVDAERGPARAQRAPERRERAPASESLAERQRLLERLSKIQRSIVSRRDLEEVFAAIVAGAQELLGDETVGLRLIDPEDPEKLNLVASAGVDAELVERDAPQPARRRAPAVGRRPRGG